MNRKRNPTDDEGEANSSIDYNRGHDARNGDVARYLEKENPNVPPELWPERFEYFKRNDELPPVKATDGGTETANFGCPDCHGELTHKDVDAAYVCDGCGQVVFEKGGGDDEL